MPGGTNVELPWADIVLCEKRILGCTMGSNRFRTDMPRYAELIAEGSAERGEHFHRVCPYGHQWVERCREPPTPTT